MQQAVSKSNNHFIQYSYSLWILVYFVFIGCHEKMENLVEVKKSSWLDPRDSNIYQTIIIGEKEWMAENLRYLPEISKVSWKSNYCIYNYFDTSLVMGKKTFNYNAYGVLYSHYIAAFNACPTGWQLPSDKEWTQLTNLFGGEEISGGKLKENGYIHWIQPNTGATDELGFSAIPGGFRAQDGLFYGLGQVGAYWSSTLSDIDGSFSAKYWSRYLYYDNEMIERSSSSENIGLSVRCVKNK